MAKERTALVTGGTDGIGQETAARLAQAGFTVLVHGRSEKRAVRAARALRGAIPVWGDFSSMRDVAELARQVMQAVRKLDVLVNNAGMYASRREITGDGFERTMAVNYFAPWLLTNALLPVIVSAHAPRVVNVSSMTHEGADLDVDDLTFARNWTAYGAYAGSKLANIAFATMLARREPALRSNALHPGVVGTKLLRAGFGMGGSSVAVGARTSVYLASAQDVASISGRYFVDCREKRPSRKARDPDFAEALWTVTERCLRDHLPASAP